MEGTLLPSNMAAKTTFLLWTAKQSVLFLKTSKEIGKAWRKSLTRARRASLTRP